MYTITLSNGRKLTGLRVNGSAFETTDEITREELLGGLKRVVIRSDGEAAEVEGYVSEGEYEYMTLGYYGRHGGVLQFVLNECDLKAREMEQLRADVDFALMLGGASF